MTTCYRPLENSVFNVSDSDIPCNGATPTGCCVYGDFCMSNGICHYTKPTTAGSGYYLQSCTDPTFQSAIGQETFHCTTLDYPDIVYNVTTGLWACCSSDATIGVQCSIATNETWAAPAPDALATIATIEQAPATATISTSSIPSTNAPESSTTSITSTLASLPFTTSPLPLTPSSNLPPSIPSSSSSFPSSSSSSSFSKLSSISSSSTRSSSESSNTAAAASMPANPSPSAASSSRTGLMAGADAGIGIGVVLGVIALIALIFFAVKHLRKRKRTRQGSAVLFGGPDPTLEIHNEHRTEMTHGAGVDIGYGYGYRPHRFTGEPRFPQELLNEQMT